MKRPTTTLSVHGNVDRMTDREDDEMLERVIVDDDDGERESVFYLAGGSIFGDTSLIDDALLREAIGGRFRF